MGKRGPSPQGEYSGKSKVFSTRIRADLRSSLDAAAKVSGRSLSQEVEHRLRRTFVDEDRSENAFGSRRNYLLMRMAATALQSAQNPQNPKAEWLDDPVAFDQAMKFLNAVLKQVRPKGSAAPVSDASQTLSDRVTANYTAASVWVGIQSADPALPLNRGTRKQQLASMLKSDLGEVAQRPHLFAGTAKEIRRHVAQLDNDEKAAKETAAKRGKRK